MSIALLKTLRLAVFIVLISCFWQGFMVGEVKADTVTLTPIADTYLSERFPNTAQHPDEHIAVGRDSTLRDRGLVSFGLSSIPSGSTIDSATLRLYCGGVWGDIGWHVTVYRATSVWTESSTWNGVTPAGSQWSTDNSVTQQIRTPTPFGWYTWDVTGIVKDWIENGQPNDGFILVSVDIETAGGHRGIDFSSRHTYDVYPTLEIDYTPPFDFSLSAGGGLTVTRGGSDSITITASLVSGSTEPVSLSVSGLPSGASASFSPQSGNPTFTSTLTIATSASTPPGSYMVTVTGTGSPAHITTFTLTVDDPYQPVGGVVISTNKLEILTPCLALAGLVAIASTVVVIKRKRG